MVSISFFSPGSITWYRKVCDKLILFEFILGLFVPILLFGLGFVMVCTWCDDFGPFGLNWIQIYFLWLRYGSTETSWSRCEFGFGLHLFILV